MAKNRQYLPDDWLAIFENRVRSTGVWCDVSVKDNLRHFFVCKNEKATIAISRCGQVIAPFEKLHENVVSKKCLVCDLYEGSGMEVKEINDLRLSEVIEKQTQTQTQTQEQ
jgi:hypothetical protein